MEGVGGFYENILSLSRVTKKSCSFSNWDVEDGGKLTHFRNDVRYAAFIQFTDLPSSPMRTWPMLHGSYLQSLASYQQVFC